MKLEDKVALVTGSAGRGMGRSIALTLAREGAKVAVNHRTSEDRAQAIVKHIESRSGDAIAVKADVFKADDCKILVDTIVEHFGRNVEAMGRMARQASMTRRKTACFSGLS